MGVRMGWIGTCDECGQHDTGYSQNGLLSRLRRAGWKVKRTKTDSGRTSYSLTCPDCLQRVEDQS